jgi:hypothetical protein
MIDLQRAIDHFRRQGRAVLVTRTDGAITAIESFSTMADALDEQSARQLSRGQTVSVLAAIPAEAGSFERRAALLDHPEE